jgi:hypothetical protein
MTRWAGNVEARAGGENLPAQLGSILCDQEDLDDLREHIKLIDGDRVGRVAILSFRSLQLYRIAQLQAALVEKQNTIMGSGPCLASEKDNVDETTGIDGLLQRYGKSNMRIHDRCAGYR